MAGANPAASRASLRNRGESRTAAGSCHRATEPQSRPPDCLHRTAAVRRQTCAAGRVRRFATAVEPSSSLCLCACVAKFHTVTNHVLHAAISIWSPRLVLRTVCMMVVLASIACGRPEPPPGTVQDEAMRAGLTAEHFVRSTPDYFHDMDYNLVYGARPAYSQPE